jgi:hypothetical protein
MSSQESDYCGKARKVYANRKRPIMDIGEMQLNHGGTAKLSRRSAEDTKIPKHIRLDEDDGVDVRIPL